MATLNDGEFELDGFGFGGEGHGLVALPGGWDPGSSSTRMSDVANPGADATRFGRDFKDGPTWAWKLVSNRDTASDALDAIEDLSVAWDAAAVRSMPGKLSTLRYNIGGRTRCVFGRSRNFAVGNSPDLWVGAQSVTCDFKLAAPVYYDDTELWVGLSIVPTAPGKLKAPLIGPLTTSNPGVRQGYIDDVGGRLATSVRIVIQGPVARPIVSLNGGWSLSLNTTLAYDQFLTIDSRPGVNTILRNDGASLAGSLSRTADLPSVRLSPGPAYINFSGTDPTGTSWCKVFWRRAYSQL